MNIILESIKQLNFNKVEYIAFDIFDTLISRDIHPEYVKKLWSSELSKVLNTNQSHDEIYRIRYDAESELRFENVLKGLDSEFNYNQLTDKLFHRIKSDMSYEDFCALLKRIEVNTEMRVQHINEDCFEALKYCKEEEKTIICISDFYLPGEEVKILLSHHGIAKYLDHIYISSDLLLTKASGRLYKYVISDLKINSDSMVMIGDNVISDYRKAGKNGIHPIWIDRTENYKEYECFWETKNSYDNVIKQSQLYQGLRSNANFEELAYTLYAFTDKLYTKLLQNGVKNVFFLSREGEFLKRLFDVYRKKQNYCNEQYIQSHYLIVSRKSTYIASLDSLDKEAFEWLFLIYPDLSVYSFLASLNFSQHDIAAVSSYFPDDLTLVITDFKHSKQLQRLLVLDIFRECYEKTRTDQKSLLQRYLYQQNVDIETEGLHVVDIGWLGTIQNNIYRTLEEKIAVTGYYIGVLYDSTMPVDDKNQKNGILFDTDLARRRQESRASKIYGRIQIIFEILLMASHGSTNGYVLNGQKVEALTKEEEKEQQLYVEKIKPVQERMHVIFLNIIDAFKKTVFSYSHYKKDFMNIHTELILFPTNEELEFFHNLHHLNTFGEFGYSTYIFREDG